MKRVICIIIVTAGLATAGCGWRSHHISVRPRAYVVELRRASFGCENCHRTPCGCANWHQEARRDRPSKERVGAAERGRNVVVQTAKTPERAARRLEKSDGRKRDAKEPAERDKARPQRDKRSEAPAGKH